MHAAIIEKQGVTIIEMEDGAIMVRGSGQKGPRFQRYLERPVQWPVAPPEVWGKAVQPDYVTHPPENDTELMIRAVQMAEDFDVHIKILED